MGLAGVKTKTKIGIDPRNTAWSNDHSRFGHKHLKQLGWTPGQGLGIGSSGQKAMTSHVKISIKSDNSGLGKKINGYNDSDMTTGLDSFQRLLGRLNGKDEAKVANQILDQKKRAIANSKYGMQFVYGGILKGSNDEEEEQREEMELEEKREKRKLDEIQRLEGEEDSISKRVKTEVERETKEKKEKKKGEERNEREEGKKERGRKKRKRNKK